MIEYNDMPETKYPKLVKQYLTTGDSLKVEFDMVGFNPMDIIQAVPTGEEKHQEFYIQEIDGPIAYMIALLKEGESTYDKSDLFPDVQFRRNCSAVGEYDTKETIKEWEKFEPANTSSSRDKEGEIEEIHDGLKTIFRLKNAPKNQRRRINNF